MTRKDYVTFADLFSREFQCWGSEESGQVLASMARQVADIFAADNPRFDRARFLDACSTSGLEVTQ